MDGTTSINNGFSGSPSAIFQRAVDKFTRSLTVKQRKEYAACSLDDVQRTVVAVQERRGNQKEMRNMARLEAFLEAMDQYRKVVEAFLNCTPFLGYVWGPIRFVLLAADTWVDSLDIILNAYEEIGDRLPSFIQYEGLFEKNPDMRRALELYYCDILEFHYHALQFLSRPGWKKLFNSAWKTFQAQFGRILDSLSRHKDLLESEKGTVTIFEAQRLRELAEAHIHEISELEKKKKLVLLVEKLDPPNYQLDQCLASEQRRGTQSGMWVLQDIHFREWSEIAGDSNPLLYVHGVPGAGKTILASLIIEYLQQRKADPVLFFYCKHDQFEKDTFSCILRGLLAQLLSQDNALASHLHEICSSKDQAGLSTMLEKLAEIAFDSQITSFVILDGLDECRPGEAEKAISWFISRQADDTHKTCGHIRLLCIGQRNDVLQRMLSSAADISLENVSHHEDIGRYVKEQACSIREDFEISPQTEADIVNRVTSVAKSMFLFAKLVMENLSTQTSRYDVIKELEPQTFPVNLKDAYERVVSTVFKEGPQQAAAIDIIGWVAYAKRPLKWSEVQATFFIQPETSTCDFHGRKLRKSCKKLCGSLIDLKRLESEPETEAVLHLVHDTARDYLLHKGLLNPSFQHAKIALFCTAYLLSTPFHFGVQVDEVRNRIRDGYYAFQGYAVSHWYDHVASVVETYPEGSTDIHERLNRQLKLFLEDYGILEKCESCLENPELINIVEILRRIPQDARARNQLSDVEWRTSCIRSTIESFGDNASPDYADRDLLCQIYGKRLFKCSRIECIHFTTGFDSRRLRDEHLNRHNRPFVCVAQHCPLQALGYETERELESHITHYHAGDDADKLLFPQPPRRKADNIHKACARGDIAAVGSFLDAGVDVNATSRDKGALTPLILAARNSHLKVCEKLLESGADADFGGPWSSKGYPALHEALYGGNAEVINWLLSRNGLLVEQTDDLGRNILHLAAEAEATSTTGSEAIVQLSLKTGKVDPGAKTKNGKTPLHFAAYSDNEAVVKLLLATGKVDPDVRNNTGKTPLHYAANRGNEAVIRLLLATGQVDPDAKNDSGITPLHYVASKGHETVVKLLLAIDKVDPDAKDNSEITPLLYAASNGYEKVVKLLLATGKVDRDAKTKNGKTPLRYARDRGDEAVIKLLLQEDIVDRYKR